MPDVLWLFRAGVLAGIVSVVASLASLVSYPALLAAGLSPLAANVTNTTALVFVGSGSAAGSRPELAGQRHRLVLAVPTGLLDLPLARTIAIKNVISAVANAVAAPSGIHHSAVDAAVGDYRDAFAAVEPGDPGRAAGSGPRVGP